MASASLSEKGEIMRLVLTLLFVTAVRADEPPRASDAPVRQVATFVLARARTDRNLSPSPSYSALKRLTSPFHLQTEVCVNQEGQVYSVKTIHTPFPEDTPRFEDYYRKQTFKPQTTNVCATFTMRFFNSGRDPG
jgi:hypothetical protein